MHKHNHHLFHFLKNKELTEIYFTIAIRTFAISMIAIFIPIFLYKSNFSFFQIFTYQLFYYIFAFIFFIIGIELIKKIGVKHTILVSIPFTILFLLLLNILKTHTWLLIIVALFIGIGMGFFWSAFHLYFTKASDRKLRSEELSYMNATTILAGIFGPFLGGVLALYFSFTLLFIVVIIVLFASIVPILFSKDPKLSLDFKIKDFFKRKHFVENTAFLGEGLSHVSKEFFWPFFIFLIGVNIAALGGVYTIANIFYALFSIIVGTLCLKFDRYKIMRIGAILHGISIAVRGLATGLLSAILFTAFGGFSNPFLNVPFHSVYYDKSAKSHFLVILIREFYLLIGRIAMITLAFILLFYFNNIRATFAIVLLIGGLAVSLQLNIKKRK